MGRCSRDVLPDVVWWDGRRTGLKRDLEVLPTQRRTVIAEQPKLDMRRPRRMVDFYRGPRLRWRRGPVPSSAQEASTP
jgi:hypothetical protein